MLEKYKERNARYFSPTGRIRTKAPAHKKLEWFILRASLVHDWKYDYSLVTKVDSKRKITIICKNHGSFTQYPYNHLSGNSCPKCTNKNTADVFYVWKVKGQNFIKIGITSSNLGDDRIGIVAANWKVVPEILVYHVCANALAVENSIKRALKKYHRPLQFKGDGHTEVFEYNEQVNNLIGDIQCGKY